MGPLLSFIAVLKDQNFNNTFFIRVESFEDWLKQHFSAEEIATGDLTSMEADPDGDTHSNYFEYRAKLNPRDAKSRIHYTYTNGADSGLRIGPIDREANPIVQSSSDLNLWTPLDSQLYSFENDEIQIDLADLLPRGFFRVVIFEE